MRELASEMQHSEPRSTGIACGASCDAPRQDGPLAREPARPRFNIAVDVRMAARDRYFGIAEYINCLVPRCVKHDSSADYTLVGSPADIAELERAAGKPVKALVDTSPIYSLREQTVLARKLSSASCDLLFCPHYSLPIAAAKPKVVTIHDLTHLKLPSSACAKLYARVFLALAARSASRIIADSEFTKRDLIATLGVPEAKIVVCCPGVHPRYGPVRDADVLSRTRETLGLPPRFVLYVGAKRKHKNVEAAIRALARVRASGQTDLSLVMTGREDSVPDGVKRAIAQSGLQDSVMSCGFVRPELMPALYSAARMLVFVSKHEGFGLPPLEAMACGTPVVASKATSIPEVVGDAALTVDPDDIDAIAQAILRVDTDERLRQRLSSEGFRRASNFCWDEATQRVLGVLHEALHRTSAERANAKTAPSDG